MALGGDFVSEADDCLGNVSCHQEMYFSTVIIPVERDSNVFGTFPIVGDGVVVVEGRHEMAGMFLADVIDARIVDEEDELYGAT